MNAETNPEQLALVEAQQSAVVTGPPFEPGVRTDMSNEDYHAVTALSASGIKRMLQSPMHYRYDRDHPTEPTDSMLVGTALHMGILEPERFATDVFAIPEDAPAKPSDRLRYAKKPSPSTLAAIEYWDAIEKAAAGKLVMKFEMFEQVRAMVEAVRRHPIHDELTGGSPELSFFWRDARLGTPCKCRFDYLRDDGVAFDLKTTQDASPDGFMRAVTTFRYHYQNAWYNNGHEHIRNESLRAFVFIVVESIAPYGVAAYVLEPNAIMFGANRCEEAMLLYEQATKTNYWRGYPETVSPLALPRWATTLVQSR